MRSEQHSAADPQPQGASGIWDLRGRQVLTWRNWDLFGAGIYNRGEGEGIWRSDQHRLIFSLSPLPRILVQLNGGSPWDVAPLPDAISFYPAGSLVRTAGADSRYAQVCWKPGLYRTIAPDLPDLPQFEPVVAFQDSLLAQLARALVEEIGRGTVDHLLADSLMSALVMRLAQRFAPVPQVQPDLPRLRLRRVLDYIETHLDQELTLAELAGVACLSPCHFSRSFKQAVGTGPQRYTVQRRVARAKTLLRDSNGTLADIAAAVGFADQSHFTAAFRRETDMPPGRYRATAA